MRITYVFHGRFPDPRAAALFAGLEASSFADSATVEIVVPARHGTSSERARAIHRIPDSVAITILPSIDLFAVPLLKEFAFQVSMLTFANALRTHLKRKAPSLVIVVDPLFATVAHQTGHTALLEVHDFPTVGNPLWIRGLIDARYVLATNAWKAQALHQQWLVPLTKLITEPNGVDLSLFARGIPQSEARQKLSLSGENPLVVYTGNLYDWKGTDTLLEAAALMPHATFALIGGTDEETAKLRTKVPANVRMVGRVPHTDVPYWQAAADVLVLPNTAKQEISSHYTSPMKLFEYMGSGRPIVASRLPSIEEIISDDCAWLVEPDSPEALKKGIEAALTEGTDSPRVVLARERIQSYSWEARARRLLSRVTL